MKFVATRTLNIHVEIYLALGSLYVASYDSQGLRWKYLTRLHTEFDNSTYSRTLKYRNHEQLKHTEGNYGYVIRPVDEGQQTNVWANVF
jgi:hypothetical protein